MKKLMVFAVLLVMAVAALDIFYKEEIGADMEFPMVNRNIEWTYTQSKNPR